MLLAATARTLVVPCQPLERGVAIRDVSGCRDLAGRLRVTVGSPAGNDAFLVAIHDVGEAPA